MLLARGWLGLVGGKRAPFRQLEIQLSAALQGRLIMPQGQPRSGSSPATGPNLVNFKAKYMPCTQPPAALTAAIRMGSSPSII